METHNTEVEEILGLPYAKWIPDPTFNETVLYGYPKEHLQQALDHQLQKARAHELEVLAVHLDRQLAGFTSVSLDSVYRYIEQRQKAIHSELDQDKR